MGFRDVSTWRRHRKLVRRFTSQQRRPATIHILDKGARRDGVVLARLTFTTFVGAEHFQHKQATAFVLKKLGRSYGFGIRRRTNAVNSRKRELLQTAFGGRQYLNISTNLLQMGGKRTKTSKPLYSICGISFKYRSSAEELLSVRNVSDTKAFANFVSCSRSVCLTMHRETSDTDEILEIQPIRRH